MGKLDDLAAIGQSIWFDYIQRSLISSGEMKRLIDAGVRGVTSNPAIFEKAIAKSNDYDLDIKMLAREGKDALGIYETLVTKDICLAADLFMSVYASTRGLDGYVSLEVVPHMAFDAQATVEEAQRLFAILKRPNVMIKVPATDEGIIAVEELVAHGVNVNVTLIFSLRRYEQAAWAYIKGLERRLSGGKAAFGVASVASFFVSRIDTAVDAELEMRNARGPRGKAAIACSKMVYAKFKEIFSGRTWEPLASRGAVLQRPLWASTSTKNPSYPDTMYVDNLIGPHTINTVPPSTLGAFLDHGAVSSCIERDIDAAREVLSDLAGLGIDLDSITSALEKDGVKAFQLSFDTLMKSIAAKMEEVAGNGES